MNLASATVLMALLAGCAVTSTVKQINRLDAVEGDPVILVMTPDIKYYLLTTGGITQPHAEWTESARHHFKISLRDHANEHGVKIRLIDDSSSLEDHEISYQKLYSAVGATIMFHQFGASPLPSKNGGFDWTLGPGTREIAEKYGAEYGLFSYYRDYQASDGRMAVAILAAIAGVGVSTGSQAGFASLVDLRSGDIVWFNRLSAGLGELMDQDGARLVVKDLLKDLPGT